MPPLSSGKRGGGWVTVQFILIGVYLAVPWQDPDAITPGSLLGLALLGLGALLFAAGVAALGRSLTPLPVPSHDARLVTSGAFRLVRHPIYSGLLFAAFGWALAANDSFRLFLAAVLFFFFDAKARFEEKVLAQRFADYASYRDRVKRFIPWIY